MNANSKSRVTVSAFIAAVVIVALILALRTELDPVLRVVNLLGTLIHEGGHSVAAILTGGQLSGMVVRPDGSGYAMLSGGNMSLALPAGYLSSTLLMALVFLINNKSRWGEVVPLIMGVVYVAITIIYGDNLAGGAVTTVVGLIGGGFLIIVGLHFDIPIPGSSKKIVFHDFLWMSIVNVLSMYYALGGILSLDYIRWHAEVGNIDDVSQYALRFFPTVHPTTMATIWMGISILIWLMVLYTVVGKPIFRKKPLQ